MRNNSFQYNCSGDYVISLSMITSYLAIITSHEADYNTEALIFKMAAARFLNIFENENNAVARIMT